MDYDQIAIDLLTARDPEEFLDVEFDKCPEYVFGMIPEAQDQAFFGTSYEDAEGVLTESQLREIAERDEAEGTGADSLVQWILNQGREGSCVGNAQTQGHMVLQARKFGKENTTRLSASSAYQLIGRSAGSGAMISDALKMGTSYGICPLDTPENRAKFGNVVMPATGFSVRRPEGIKEVSAHFRFDPKGTRVVRSKMGLRSALARRHPVLVGREGHSILYLRNVWSGSAWRTKYANSWGDWGDKGFGYDTERQTEKSSSWAFAITSIVIPDFLVM
jgi:hypothetical protein